MTVELPLDETMDPPAGSALTDIGPISRGRLYRRRRAEQRARLLETRYGGLGAQAMLAVLAREIFPGRIAVVSSFGTESAVLLDLVRSIDPGLPVVFIDSGRHFDETLAYAETLRSHFGLTNLRTVAPAPGDLQDGDPAGTLAGHNPDLCCHLRKTLPLERALDMSRDIGLAMKLFEH